MRKRTRPRTIFGPLHVVTTKEGNWEISLAGKKGISRITTFYGRKGETALGAAKRFLSRHAHRHMDDYWRIDDASKKAIRVFIAFHDVKEEKPCE